MTSSNYILGQVIARGGMAEVFRGLHVGKDGFQRLVAIKRILPQHASNTEYAAMFRDEAHIGQRLQHANIVKVEGYEVIEGSPAIVMECVDGSDLRAILAEIEKSRSIKRIPVPATLFVIAEAARGLHYAHQRRDDVSGRPLEIVHRDISPQNILISFNGEVKVTDFGIASADQDFKNTETRAGIVKGKYSYMSPEQISAKKVDARSDVFALSIVFWEILAMRRMFAADSEVEVIEMVKNCRIPGRLADYNSEVTPELEALVLKGLARDPARRFGSMDDMERALRSYLSKAYPNFTVGDLGTMMKDVLANRHDASQEEIKKMLTSSNLKAAAKSSISALEMEIGSVGNFSTKALNVSKRPGGSNDNAQRRAATPGQPAPTRSGAVPLQSNYRTGGISSKIVANKKRKYSQWIGPIWFAVTVMIAIAAFLFKTQMNSAKDGFLLQMRVNPAIIKIKVNGKNVQGGRYVRTPVNIKLEPGTNLIELARPGYTTETVSVDTTRNEQRVPQSVDLKPKVNFSQGRIISDIPYVQIVINEGFQTGSITPQQKVIEVKDLQEGVASNILVSEKGKPPFRCRFTPPRATAKRPFILVISAETSTCEIRTPRGDRGEP